MQNTDWHNDNWRGKIPLENIHLSIYLQGSKGLCGVLLWEGVGDRTELQYFDPHSYALCLSHSPGLLNRKPRGPLCWVMAFFTASYQQLLWTPTHRGPRGPLRPGVAFPTTSYQQLISNRLTSVLTELYNSSTPTQSLEWHQAEITVMQFTGHSLPVHQSMSVPWEF